VSTAHSAPARAASKGGGVISIKLEDDGSYSELGSDGSKVKLAPAKITLNDCLACSGCITSAVQILKSTSIISLLFSNPTRALTVQNLWQESVLITQQSVDELLSVLRHPSAPPAAAGAVTDAPRSIQLVVSVAPQCWVSKKKKFS
jgi:iron only hydrogenase large subunit-like protein